VLRRFVSRLHDCEIGGGSTNRFAELVRRMRIQSGNKNIRNPPMRLILLIVLILLLIGALPLWPYSSGWGYYPGSGLGLVLVIVLILVLMGRI
jgi:hypothetical protein